MKICYVLPKFSSDTAENFYHIINFLENLALNNELYLIVEKSSDINKVNVKNVREIFVLSDGKSPQHAKRFSRMLKIYFALNKIGVRIFFARASLTGVTPLILGKMFKKNDSKVLFWSCGQDVAKLSFSLNKENIKKLTSKLLAWFIFKRIDFLVTGPKTMVDYYHNNYPIPYERIIMLFNDISLDRFLPLTSSAKQEKKKSLDIRSKKIILYVHTFNKCRGADMLPMIAKRIKKENIDANIIAIGRIGDYSDNLKLEIQSHGLQKYITIIENLPNRLIHSYYQVSDIFIMPSDGEGFPRVLLEAMASGIPSISFEVGGVKDILPPDFLEELLIKRGNYKEFVNRIFSLIENEKKIREISKISVEHVEQNFSTQKVVEMYEKNLINL